LSDDSKDHLVTDLMHGRSGPDSVSNLVKFKLLFPELANRFNFEEEVSDLVTRLGALSKDAQQARVFIIVSRLAAILAANEAIIGPDGLVQITPMLEVEQTDELPQRPGI